MIAQLRPVDGEKSVDLTAYHAARKLCVSAETLRRAEVILVTEMPKLSFEETEPLIDLVDSLLRKIEGQAKDKLTALLNNEKAKLRRHNAWNQAKTVEEKMLVMKNQSESSE